MNRTHACVALGSLLVGLAGCAHEDGTRKRTTISAVTNEEMAGDRGEQGKTRMSYTEVDDEEALHRDEERAELAAREASRADRSRRTASTDDALGVQQAPLRDASGLDRAEPMQGTSQPRPLVTASQRTERTAVVREEPSAAPPCERAVFFASKSAELNWTAEEQLKRVAECIQEGKVEQAVIIGRADPRGTSRANRRLEKERAQAVAEYLQKLGVEDDAIKVRSRGAVASSDSEQLYPVERRATVTVQ